MPNWCSNNLTISGPDTDLDTILTKITVTELGRDALIFNTLFPMPELLEGTTSPTPDSPEPHPNWAILLAEGTITQEWHDELVAKNIKAYEDGQKAYQSIGYFNWYDWQYQNWGVKWGDSNTRFTSDPSDSDDIRLMFDTPWGPPIKGITKISEQFPNCTFTISFSEEGMEFMGAARIINGEIVAETEVSGEDFPKFPEDADMDDDAAWDNFNRSVMDMQASLEGSL